MNQDAILKRQNSILAEVNAVGYITIEELAAQFNKTTQTIRADVATLASAGKLRRYHGGVAPPVNREQTPYLNRQILNHAEKTKIAHETVRLIEEGACLYLGIGTTVETIAYELKKFKKLRIVTNNINIISIFSECPDFEIYIAGGEIRKNDLAVVGETALEFLNNFRVEYSIIGISGIDANGDLLDYDFRESNILRLIISTAKNTILVADSSKFSIFPITRVANLKDLSHFITDKEPSKKIRQICETNDVILKISK